MQNLVTRAALLAAAIAVASAAPGAAQNPPKITFYATAKFSGASLQLILPANDLHGLGFANKTMSFTVASGTWQLCDHPNFTGHCITVGPGKYPAGYAGSFAPKIVSAQPVSKPAP